MIEAEDPQASEVFIDHDCVLKALHLLSINYNKPVGDGLDLLWLNQLGQVQRQDFEKAIRGVISRQKFWPTIADVMEELRVVERTRTLSETKPLALPQKDLATQKKIAGKRFQLLKEFAALDPQERSENYQKYNARLKKVVLNES